LSTVVSYGRYLTERADRHPDRTAVVHVDPDGVERLVSWLELEQRANQVARLFAERGVTQGSLVAIAVPNLPQHLFSTYAAWKLGATVLPMRWSLPEWEQARLIELAEPVVIVREASADDSRTVTLDEIDATVTLDDRPLPDRIAQPAQAIATSGSTGRPKLIVAPVPGTVDTAAPVNPMALAGDQVIQLLVSPLYHTNGFGCHIRLLGGATVILMQRFDAALAVRLIEKWKVNQTVMVPTMLQRIARLPDLTPEPLATLTHVYYGGAPLAPWIARRWIELVGPDHFFLQYGGTEQMGGCMCTGGEWLLHEGTAGRPVDCALRIQDAEGVELPPGEIGEIFLRKLVGPLPFRYVGAPMPKTTEDGFCTYGDLGWVDEDGYLYIADRRIDMVITGGANVYPAEVELALSEHPQVGDAAVIGLPDPEWGRRLHAIIEPTHPGQLPDVEELRQHCRTRLAPYKVPKTFEIVERLPRSEAGKISRSTLLAAREEATSAGT
jgi:bile acid-coenzyme A ligase